MIIQTSIIITKHEFAVAATHIVLEFYPLSCDFGKIRRKAVKKERSKEGGEGEGGGREEGKKKMPRFSF